MDVRTPATQKIKTFGELCNLELRLLQVLIEAKRMPPTRHSYDQLKRKLLRLVGWDAEVPALRTRAAYDTVLEVIIDALDAQAVAMLELRPEHPKGPLEPQLPAAPVYCLQASTALRSPIHDGAGGLAAGQSYLRAHAG